MLGIANYLKALIGNIHRHPSALSDLSRQAGLSHATLDRIRRDPVELGAGGFNPTFRTIREVEKFLGADTYLNVMGKRTHVGERSNHLKILLGLSSGLWIDDQIRRAHDYLEFVRAENGRIGMDLVDYGFLTELCPDCAIHFISVATELSLTSFNRWGVAKDFRGGRDFTGVTFQDFGDSELAACFCEDLPMLLNSAFPLLTVHRRITDWPETGERVERRFLRLAARISGLDEQPTMVSIQRLQEPGAGLEILDCIIDKHAAVGTNLSVPH
jgi:hypothetical protein